MWQTMTPHAGPWAFGFGLDSSSFKVNCSQYCFVFHFCSTEIWGEAASRSRFADQISCQGPYCPKFPCSDRNSPQSSLPSRFTEPVDVAYLRVQDLLSLFLNRGVTGFGTNSIIKDTKLNSRNTKYKNARRPIKFTRRRPEP